MISYPLLHPPWCSNPCVDETATVVYTAIPLVVDLPSFKGCDHHFKYVSSNQRICYCEQLWHLRELREDDRASTQAIHSS